MSVKSLLFLGRFFLLIIVLTSCQGGHRSKLSGTNSFTTSVTYLNPERAENQLASGSSYDGQIILTVESNEVIKELSDIEEIHNAVAEITFYTSYNSFDSVVYHVHFKKGVNPIPYYKFFNEYEGVIGVEFDGVVGLAGSPETL